MLFEIRLENNCLKKRSGSFCLQAIVSSFVFYFPLSASQNAL